MVSDLAVIEGLRAAFAAPAQTPSAVSTTTGTVTADSADGSVTVDLGGASTTCDGEQAIELPTQADCREGDTVMVTLVGGSPVVTGVVGGGDRTRAETAPAVTDTQAYYLLADSAPDQPTEDAHDGWATTEPTWSADSTQTLWRSVRSETVGGDIAWSAPCEVSAYANVTVARNAIISTVEESYVTSDAASATYATKTEVTQTASALDVRITSADSKADEAATTASATDARLSASIDQLSDSVSEQVGQVSDSLGELSADVAADRATRDAYMRFTTDAGGNPLLSLGATDSAQVMELTNEELRFVSDGQVAATMSGGALDIPNAVVRTLHVGGYAVTATVGGGIDFSWVGVS